MNDKHENFADKPDKNVLLKLVNICLLLLHYDPQLTFTCGGWNHQHVAHAAAPFGRDFFH